MCKQNLMPYINTISS